MDNIRKEIQEWLELNTRVIKEIPFEKEVAWEYIEEIANNTPFATRVKWEKYDRTFHWVHSDAVAIDHMCSEILPEDFGKAMEILKRYRGIVISDDLSTENKESTLMEFESSNGTLLLNRDGLVDVRSDIAPHSWLENISRVDIEELDHYYKIQGLGKCTGGDVLDFGWWDKKGCYNKPEIDWRMETFHCQYLTEDEVKDVVEESYEWIAKHRVRVG